jgi:uroporphyrinogen-III decarboxylase
MKIADQIEKNNKTLEYYRSFWLGEITGPIVSMVVPPAYRQMLDRQNFNLDEIANAAAECIRADIASDEQFILPAIYPDFGTISTAKMYGGKVIPPAEGGGVHIETVINDVNDLSKLQACSYEDSDFKMAVDLYRLVCDKLQSDAIFTRTPDFQGPMNTLALVMDQTELMVAMYEEPDAIHAALDSITSTLIEYHKRFRKEIGGGKVIGSIWPYTFLPEELGASLTQDMMPLLSPDIYRDFEIPCLRRIADAFGGLQIHCCGNYSQHLPALKDSGIKIRSLEFHYPFTPFKDIYQLFGDDIIYIPFLFGENKDYPDYVDFAGDLLKQGTDETRFWFASAQGWVNDKALRELINR